MPSRRATEVSAPEWTPRPDPDGKFSSGIPDFDRLLGGGFPRGCLALFRVDDTVGIDDLDLVHFPTYLNFLYQSRGILAVLPSRDAPHRWRARLTQYVTRRRFDSRVRVMDYVGEDEGLSYVVNITSTQDELRPAATARKERQAAVAKVIAAEKAVQGNRKKPFIESHAFEVFDMLMGTEKALKMFYHGVKRARAVGNLAVGILGPGLGCEAGVRRMADMEFALHREDVGLIVRGVRPAFRSCVVQQDPARGAPAVSFVPRPP